MKFLCYSFHERLYLGDILDEVSVLKSPCFIILVMKVNLITKQNRESTKGYSRW